MDALHKSLFCDLPCRGDSKYLKTCQVVLAMEIIGTISVRVDTL